MTLSLRAIDDGAMNLHLGSWWGYSSDLLSEPTRLGSEEVLGVRLGGRIAGAAAGSDAQARHSASIASDLSWRRKYS